ncbi:MAG: alpha-E domain-containing protein [Bacteroidota bacterium]
MLARVAESLYWIGRNIERCEHCARYMHVQYFSTLEAPMSQNKSFTLRSILFMSGSEFDTAAIVNESEVWQKVIFDGNNSSSLFSLARNARENARSIRNNISTELWEAINKWYLFFKNVQGKKFSSSKVFPFSAENIAHIALIRSTINTTLLHNDIWGFLNLGIHTERSLQVLRILKSKISDSIILSNNGVNIPLLQYQWTTLLKSVEAFDIYKKYYRGILSKETIFELILTNSLFPRSLVYSTEKIKFHLQRISVRTEDFDSVFKKIKQRVEECTSFSEFEHEEKVIENIAEAYECISDFHYHISKLYFQ